MWGCHGVRTARDLLAYAPNVHFFSSQRALFFFLTLTFLWLFSASMSDYSSFTDDFDKISFDRPSPQSNVVPGLGIEDMVSQRKSRPPLRSRPDIDFSRSSSSGSDVGIYAPTRQPSNMSGSMLV